MHPMRLCAGLVSWLGRAGTRKMTTIRVWQELAALSGLVAA
eukprot:COSAG03_NODE_23992_length_275_cov_1.159091_1_plen_40_part_01